MSRNYGEWCNYCDSSKGRSDFIGDDVKLFQCTGCGSCWKETRFIKKLGIDGKTEKAWKLAVKEVLKQ